MFSLSLKDGFKNLILVTIFILGVCSRAFGFSIDSTVFDQRIDTGGYREFVLENKTDKPARYKFDIKKGESLPDMSEWVKVYPKVINIPPLEKRTLKVYAQSPSGTKLGEYAFNLVVTPLIVPTISEEEGKIVGNSTVGFVPVVEMRGYIGNPKFEENINLSKHNFKMLEDKKIEYSATLENKSFTGVHIGLKFVTSTGNIIDGKWLGRIGKGQTQEFKYILSEKVKKIDEIKEIVIYDATNLVDIKRIKL